EGELDPERAVAFRAHLRTCEHCRTGLVEVMLLTAQLSTLPQLQRRKRFGPAWQLAHPTLRAAFLAVRAYAFRIALGLAGVTAAAVYALWPTAPAVNAFAEVETRPYEVRFAYTDAAGYRPMLAANLGSHSATKDVDRVSFAGVSALETRGDRHG